MLSSVSSVVRPVTRVFVRGLHKSHDTSILQTAWNPLKHGGEYTVGEFPEARDFFRRWGFVVIKDVMSEQENEQVKKALVNDVHEINPKTKEISDVSGFPEADLPTSPNHSFRTTCNIVFGRFANAIRSHQGVRESFAQLHGVPRERLGCSWDTIFYTSDAKEVTNNLATQLHWDHNGYCGGEPVPLAEDLCIQGVYYATATGASTPSFCCSPGSQDVWPKFSESDLNPSKAGDKLLNYMPVEPFGDDFVTEAGLPAPVRIHVPACSLLLWSSRTCHGNSPPIEKPTGSGVGRVSLAISFGPVDKRSVATQKDALLKALGGVRTTHHPALMLSHDKQGYPVDWTAEAEYEPNKSLTPLHLSINPAVTNADLSEMIQRSDMDDSCKTRLIDELSVDTIQLQVYRSYWHNDTDYYEQLSKLRIEDLRRVINPELSEVQGLHHTEKSGETAQSL